MTNNPLPLLWPLLLALLLTGCGSSPQVNYYRLTAEAAAVPSGDSPALGVGPIEIPAYLDRDKFVYQQKGNTLKVAATEQWAEPLEAGIERVMALNLASLLNTQNVRTFPWHSKRAPEYGIRVNILNLDGNDTEATLTAEWLVYRPASGEAVQRRINRLQLPLAKDSPGPEQIPAAFSKLLHQLSEIIAAAITADAGVAGET
jgi:uncharacterized lipoprotein YmbA